MASRTSLMGMGGKLFRRRRLSYTESLNKYYKSPGACRLVHPDFRNRKRIKYAGHNQMVREIEEDRAAHPEKYTEEAFYARCGGHISEKNNIVDVEEFQIKTAD